MSAHTPGPWTVHTGMRDCVTFEGRHGTENLFLENLDGYYACQSEADARLIATAPELIAVLTELRAMCHRQLDFNDDGDGAMFERADAAIAKATGAAHPTE